MKHLALCGALFASPSLGHRKEVIDIGSPCELFVGRSLAQAITGGAEIRHQAPYSGGEFLRKPMIFSGKRLSVNFATSALGRLQVEIQDAEGTPIDGYRLDESTVHCGDSTEQTISWAAGSDVSSLAGTPVRLFFVLKDGDLYSFQFQE